MNTRTIFFVFLTLMLWGVIPIFDKLALDTKRIPPIIGICLRISAAVIVLAPLLLTMPQLREGWSALSLRQGLAFAASGIISLVIAQYFYYEALKGSQVSRLFPLLFGGAPVVTMILGWLFLGETITAATATGGLLITFGSALMFL
ncbi:MAG TPA: DMT family transporter [Candidatus Ozemobacteraceae bacterium]